VNKPRYGLTLFVTGATPRSMRAIANLRNFCEEDLHGAYELEVVDLYDVPERAQPANVLVSPTLVRDHPKPVKLLIGDMSDTERLRAVIKV
jgi:circadian clock protein KaiB